MGAAKSLHLHVGGPTKLERNLYAPLLVFGAFVCVQRYTCAGCGRNNCNALFPALEIIHFPSVYIFCPHAFRLPLLVSRFPCQFMFYKSALTPGQFSNFIGSEIIDNLIEWVVWQIHVAERIQKSLLGFECLAALNRVALVVEQWHAHDCSCVRVFFFGVLLCRECCLDQMPKQFTRSKVKRIEVFAFGHRAAYLVSGPAFVGTDNTEHHALSFVERFFSNLYSGRNFHSRCHAFEKPLMA